MQPHERFGASTTLDGRLLTWLEVGDPKGPLLLHNHGGPSSRLEARLFSEGAAKHRLRLICIDRPGIGHSTPQRQRTYSGWSRDLVEIADSLGCQTFGVSGWSEGGPWALGAAAFIDPLRLQHVTSIAPGSYGALGTNWAASYLNKVDALGGWLATHCRPLFHCMYAILGVTARDDPQTYLKKLRAAVSAYDRRILEDCATAQKFSEASAECFQQGSKGLVEDSLALYRKWDFDIGSIKRPVHLWQGNQDSLVPEVINRVLAERMPGAIWHEVEGAGHFISIGEMDNWMSIAAQELAGKSASFCPKKSA